MKYVLAITSLVMFAAIGACSEQDASPRKPATVQSATEDAQKLGPQATCPVMGGAIDRDFYADYEGKRVYFCCAGCEKTFLADPVKYLEKLAADGQEPETLKKAGADVKGVAAPAGCADGCSH